MKNRSLGTAIGIGIFPAIITFFLYLSGKFKWTCGEIGFSSRHTCPELSVGELILSFVFVYALFGFFYWLRPK